MEKPELSKLSALVVDDFSSFRSTIMGMLNKIGIKNISEAARGQDALKMCKDHRFDVVLCDYNLGAGRNGQQLLEELRYRKWITRNTLFFMVTAEASKEMVLSAYDCEPDDYLMKPLNLRVLEQRISRLTQQRKALKDVYQQIDGDNTKAAIANLETLVTTPGRHQLSAQKLLGEQYLAAGDWQKAERLYQAALEARKLDWAVLGLAKVLELKGDRQAAMKTLNELVKDSKLFLPAYDELVNLHEKQGDLDAMQSELARVTEISPRSILRQRKLAEVANVNGDMLVTMKAAMEAIKLGEKSCFKEASDSMTFLEAAGNAAELNLVPETTDIVEESKKCLNQLVQSNRLGLDDESRAKLLTARVFALEGHKDEADKLAQEELQLAQGRKSVSVDRDLARYQYLNTAGQYDEANRFVDELFQRYEGNQEALERLDKLLPEPRSEENRQRVAKLNKAGIDAYQQGSFDQALVYFHKATVLYPRHTGIQLNLLQTLVGKLKLFPDSKELQAQLNRQLQKLSALLTDRSSPQYARFEKLREKAIAALQ